MGKSGCIRAKMLYSGKVFDFEQKWINSGKNGCIRAELLHSGKSVCIRAIVVVFAQQWLYSGRVVIFGQE